MELFTARVCPYAHRTRLALLEKGLDFEHIEIDFANKPPRFLEASPYGKVPALVDDGATLYESLIINEYLEERYGGARLMPADPTLRAKSRIWIHYFDEYFNKDYHALLRAADPLEQENALETVRERMRFVESAAFDALSGDGPYWLGAEVSLVDLAWWPFFERLPAYTHYRGLRITPETPKLARWAAAMAERPAVRRIANDPSYYIERYARYAS